MAGEDDGVVLDYSAASSDETRNLDANAGTGVDALSAESFGTRTGKGQFVLKDLDNEVHSILQGANDKKAQSSSPGTGVVGSSLGAISGLFRNLIGGKVLTKEDLDKSMKGMEEHLLKKNVAREAAVRLCEGVERELIGVKTGSFESIIDLFLDLTRWLICASCPIGNPYSYGIVPPQDPYPNHLPRYPPFHYRHHLSVPSISHPPKALRYLYCRRQRRRKINKFV